jgi:hypothetical protein
LGNRYGYPRIFLRVFARLARTTLFVTNWRRCLARVEGSKEAPEGEDAHPPGRSKDKRSDDHAHPGRGDSFLAADIVLAENINCARYYGRVCVAPHNDDTIMGTNKADIIKARGTSIP